MGLTVEKAIVIGIFVVIVAILGIAISGAMGSDGSLFGTPQHVAATSGDPDGAAGERKLLLRDADISKVAEAARRQQETARRRDAAVREMTGQPGPVVKGPTPTPVAPPSAGAPTDRDLGTALKRNAEPVVAPEPGPAAEDAPPAYVEYAVVQGDTLWKIARRHYGDGDIKRIVDVILAANPEVDGDNIKAGETVLKLPVELPDNLQSPPVLKKSAPAAAKKAAASDAPSNSTVDTPKYEVGDGDSLRRIARRELGDESRWEEIYELNRQYLSAPEKLYPGQTLLMPAR